MVITIVTCVCVMILTIVLLLTLLSLSWLHIFIYLSLSIYIYIYICAHCVCNAQYHVSTVICYVMICNSAESWRRTSEHALVGKCLKRLKPVLSQGIHGNTIVFRSSRRQTAIGPRTRNLSGGCFNTANLSMPMIPTGVCAKNNPLMWASALQNSSSKFSPAPDLVSFKLVVARVLFSGGVFSHRHRYD